VNDAQFLAVLACVVAVVAAVRAAWSAVRTVDAGKHHFARERKPGPHLGQ